MMKFICHTRRTQHSIQWQTNKQTDRQTERYR